MPYSYDRTASQSKLLGSWLKKISEGVFRAMPDRDGNLDSGEPPLHLFNPSGGRASQLKTWAALLQQGLLTAGPKVGFRVTVELSAKGQAELVALTDKHQGKVLYESGREGYHLIVDVTVDDRRIGRWQREITERDTFDRGIILRAYPPNLGWQFDADDPELTGLASPHKFEGERLPAAAKKWLEGELRRRGVIA